MPKIQNPFEPEENLKPWFDTDKFYLKSKYTQLKNFTNYLKNTAKYSPNYFMSIQSSYHNIVHMITKNAIVATLVMILALGTVSATVAQLFAPENLKPSTVLGGKKSNSSSSSSSSSSSESNSSSSSSSVSSSTDSSSSTSSSSVASTTPPLANAKLKTVVIYRESVQFCLNAISNTIPLFAYKNPDAMKPVVEYNGGDYIVTFYRIESLNQIIPGKYTFNAYPIPSGGDNLDKNYDSCEYLASNKSQSIFSKEIELKPGKNSVLYYNSNRLIKDNFGFWDDAANAKLPSLPQPAPAPQTKNLKTYTNQYFPDFKLVYPEDWRFETSTISDVKNLNIRIVKLTKGSQTLEFRMSPSYPGGMEPIFIPDAKTCLPGSSYEQLEKQGVLKITNLTNGVRKFDVKTTCPNETINGVYYGELNVTSFIIKSNIRGKSVGYEYSDKDGLISYRIAQVGGDNITDNSLISEIDQIISQSSFK